MAQVNKYADMAAYAADTDRLATKSAVSFLQADNLAIYDGVNCTVEKASAAEGDLVVYDKSESRVRFVKADTLVKAQLPDSFYPFGVVLGWKNGKVIFTTLLGLPSQKWAHAYEVKLSGFDTTASGTASVVVQDNATHQETVTVTWEAGATLASIATSLTTAFAALIYDDDKKWTAAAVDSDIILSHNYSVVGTVVSATGATIAAADETNYQTSYAYLSATEYISCKAGIHNYVWGCNYPKFYDYYHTSGTTPTADVSLTSAAIVNESSFNDSEYCAALRGKYATYADYLHDRMVQYPSAYGASIRDGKTTSDWLASQLGTTVRGASEPRYPAAYAASNYGITVEGHTTGFETGAWWLPSVDEISMMMRNRKLNAAATDVDLVNATLTKMSGTAIYGNGYYPWTCSECSSYGAFIYSGYCGYVSGGTKYGTYYVRPVAAF